MKTITVDPLLNEVMERTCRELDDEFIRQSTERYKQTDRYKEYVKRKQQAEQDLPESAKGE